MPTTAFAHAKCVYVNLLMLSDWTVCFNIKSVQPISKTGFFVSSETGQKLLKTDLTVT